MPSKPMSRYTLILHILFLPLLSQAQEVPALDWPAFRNKVLTNHPLARQADLNRDQARAALLRARGGFDPKLYADINGKNFNDKTYFQYSEAGFKWPLGLGIELKGNYNLASGDFLNTESKLPKNGQVAAGLSWTLGQGLFIDERRAALRESRIGLDQAEAERSAALNNLLLDAAKAYWTWAIAVQQLRIYEDALTQARVRHAGIRESYLQGDKPAIDTLESFIQVQNRLLDVNFARVEAQNAAAGLGNFFQTGDYTPVSPGELPPPASLEQGNFPGIQPTAAETLIESARQQHPELLLYATKRRILEVERRLKVEKLKPVATLNYQLLGNGWQFFPSTGPSGAGVLVNDIKWGVQLSYPILNRKARGDRQITQVKIAQTDLTIQQKTTEISNKVRQYANALNTLSEQIGLYRNITSNYRDLLDAENEKLRFGESSVFLINTREQRWLDAQIKYLKLLSEYRKTEAGLQWSAGQLIR